MTLLAHARRSLILIPTLLPSLDARAQSAQLSSAAPAATLLAQPARLTVRNVPLRTALAQLVESSDVPLALSPSQCFETLSELVRK